MLNQNKRKISNLILFILIIVITGITCKNDSADKKKENLTLLSLLAYQQANTNKPVVDTTPTCSYTSTGGTQTNVFLSTATTASQSIRYVVEDLGFGASLQSYSMIRVTTKASGKLTFTGSPGSGLFSIRVYANVDPCVVNAKTNFQLTTVFTADTTNIGITLTFNQANTYLVLSSIALNTETPTISVKYSD